MIVVPSADGVVGHLAHWKFRTWVRGEEGLILRPGDTVVAEAFRGRGLLRTLTVASMPDLADCDLRVAFPRAWVGAAASHYGAGEVLGLLPQWVRWTTEAALARSMPRAALRGTARVALPAVRRAGVRARRRIGPGAIDVVPLELGADVDDLARASKSFAPFVRIRDSAYLRWRWFQQPMATWTLHGVRRSDGSLPGWSVSGVVETPHGPEGVVADVLAEDERTLAALLRHAASALESEGCGLVTFGYHDPRPWAARACRAAGFLPRGEGPTVMARRVSDEAQVEPPGWEPWYFTMGDSDLL